MGEKTVQLPQVSGKEYEPERNKVQEDKNLPNSGKTGGLNTDFTERRLQTEKQDIHFATQASREQAQLRSPRVQGHHSPIPREVQAISGGSQKPARQVFFFPPPFTLKGNHIFLQHQPVTVTQNHLTSIPTFLQFNKILLKCLTHTQIRS